MNAVDLAKPFVLRCPNCMAPSAMSEPGTITRCEYCDCPMVWEPVQSLSRDDSRITRLKAEVRSSGSAGGSIMGFGPVAIAANSNGIIQITPQMPFRGRLLYIPPQYAPNFVINNFMIGMRSQFITANAIPASRCSVGEGLEMNMVNAFPGQFMTLDVQNISMQAQTIMGAITGDVAAEGPGMNMRFLDSKSAGAYESSDYRLRRNR